MSKNIFNESGNAGSSSINTTSITTNTLTTSGLTINGGTKGDVLIINDGGVVEGIALGANNHVFVANPLNNGLPGYTNALDVNTVTCNDLKITGLQTGDLIVGQSNDFVERLPIGASGNILTSDGTRPFWQPIVLPDPLILQDLNLTQSLKLGFAYGHLFVDGNNNVYGDRSSFYFDTNNVVIGVALINISNFNMNVVNGRTYKLSLNFQTQPNNNITFYQVRLNSIIIRQWFTQSSDNQTIIHCFVAQSSGNLVAELLGLTPSNTTTALNFNWTCEPLLV